MSEPVTIDAGGLLYPAFVAGPSDGECVLCLHGFPDCHRSFRHQLGALASAGYRVVAPALRGYAPGTFGDGRPFHLAALADDVFILLDALGVDRAHLIGHDWGAAIGYAAAAERPERLRSFTAIAVPHPLGLVAAIPRRPIQLRYSWYMGLFQLDGVAERIVRRKDFAFLMWLWRQWSPGWVAPAEELAAVKQTFAAPGVVEAALAYYRDSGRMWKDPAMQRGREALKRPIRVPTMALLGATDGCMDGRCFERAMRPADHSAGLRVERIEGAGHFMHQERPEAVNPMLLEWLAAHGVPTAR